MTRVDWAELLHEPRATETFAGIHVFGTFIWCLSAWFFWAQILPLTGSFLKFSKVIVKLLIHECKAFA